MNPKPNPDDDDAVLRALEHWIHKAVLGLNLCPFAHDPVRNGRLSIVVSHAYQVETLLADLERELLRLQQSSPESLETVLLAHPRVLQSFDAYLDFLPLADLAVQQLGLRGEIQVASFHPQYQFGDAEPGAIENYTNRAPVPCLHLLREASVSRAVENLTDPDAIYQRNIETMRRLGFEGWLKLWSTDDSP